MFIFLFNFIYKFIKNQGIKIKEENVYFLFNLFKKFLKIKQENVYFLFNFIYKFLKIKLT